MDIPANARELPKGIGKSDTVTLPAGRLWAQVECGEADFVLCDYDMKPMNSIGFVKLVRRNCPPPLTWIPIIMITAYTELRRIETARDAGITKALLNAVTPRNLYDRIVQIIERPRRFVKPPEFAGPDRRRRRGTDYEGPKRRFEADHQDGEIVDF